MKIEKWIIGDTNQLMRSDLLHNGLEHAGRDKSYQFQFMGKFNFQIKNKLTINLHN